MRFLVLFSGRVQPDAQPKALSQGHFAWLNQTAEIRDFGGLRPAGGGDFEGAAWWIEADTEAEARAIIAGDPYTQAGVWYDIRLWRWTSPRPAHPTSDPLQKG